MRLLLLPLIMTASLLLSACASLPPADPQRAQRLYQEAQTQVLRDDYPGAARLYEEAARYAPQNADYWLQWGDLLEATDDSDEAAEAWTDALTLLPLDDPLRPTLVYRLGLLLAGPLQQPLVAKELRDQLQNPVMRGDLDAVLAMAGKRPAATLTILKQTLPLATDQDQQARIYFHAAQAHAQLGNFADSREMLFYAVNSATSPGLKVAIRTLFTELINQPQQQK